MDKLKKVDVFFFVCPDGHEASGNDADKEENKVFSYKWGGDY
ncbi:MAG: hypothetical protein WC099_00760 [Candidatus Paceibacterota bacterium]